jgi:hypothetical protein
MYLVFRYLIIVALAFEDVALVKSVVEVDITPQAWP